MEMKKNEKKTKTTMKTKMKTKMKKKYFHLPLSVAPNFF